METVFDKEVLSLLTKEEFSEEILEDEIIEHKQKILKISNLEMIKSILAQEINNE